MIRKIRKTGRTILLYVFALLTILPFVWLSSAAQDETPTASWAHLYTRYDRAYLIGQIDQEYFNNIYYDLDVVCRLSDGTECLMQTNATLYKKTFVIALDISIDPLSVQSVTVFFPEVVIEDDLRIPSFEFTADDLICSTPVLTNDYSSFESTCEGTVIRVPMPLDTIMFLPLQGREQILSDISFDFGSKMVPTRYTYDGQTLVINKLGAVSHIRQITMGKRSIERSFQFVYKENAQECTINIDPPDSLLFQQRRLLWLYLISGGIFERFAWFFKNLF